MASQAAGPTAAVRGDSAARSGRLGGTEEGATAMKARKLIWATAEGKKRMPAFAAEHKLDVKEDRQRLLEILAEARPEGSLAKSAWGRVRRKLVVGNESGYIVSDLWHDSSCRAGVSAAAALR